VNGDVSWARRIDGTIHDPDSVPLLVNPALERPYLEYERVVINIDAALSKWSSRNSVATIIDKEIDSLTVDVPREFHRRMAAIIEPSKREFGTQACTIFLGTPRTTLSASKGVYRRWY
jgi:hypothetical protein